MFPNNSVISGVTLIAATETQPGHVTHDSPDVLTVGEFDHHYSQDVLKEESISAAKKFVELYKASGKVECVYNQNVGFVR